jgi:cytochrome c551/c552
MLKQYCVACHSTNVKSGGFVLQGVPAENPVDRAEVWEKVVRRVRAGEMPPAGMPTPGEASLKAFTAELVRDLDAAATRSPYAGPTTVRRINRTEYANAIADLLAIELPVAAELPQTGSPLVSTT